MTDISLFLFLVWPLETYLKPCHVFALSNTLPLMLPNFHRNLVPFSRRYHFYLVTSSFTVYMNILFQWNKYIRVPFSNKYILVPFSTPSNLLKRNFNFFEEMKITKLHLNCKTPELQNSKLWTISLTLHGRTYSNTPGNELKQQLLQILKNFTNRGNRTITSGSRW